MVDTRPLVSVMVVTSFAEMNQTDFRPPTLSLQSNV